MNKDLLARNILKEGKKSRISLLKEEDWRQAT